MPRADVLSRLVADALLPFHYINTPVSKCYTVIELTATSLSPNPYLDAD